MGYCLSKRFRLVSEADCDEVVEELVESVDVTRRVGREVSHPFDGPLERGIGPALPVDVPPAGGLQDDERIRRRLLARESTSDRPDAFVKYIVGGSENFSDNLFQCFSSRCAEDSSPKLERSEIRCQFVL